MSKVLHSFLLIITILLINSTALAQSNGKLYGKVVDAATGEPLIGATVIINGANLGATADAKGNFIILKIPPATYSVTASSVGYQKVTFTGVEVIVDRSTELNFKLPDKSIQMEQVVVIAERPKIVKDQTSTSNTLTQDQLKIAPIEGIRGALDLSSGFQKTDNGNYRVRGSGSYEVSYLINGVEQINSSNTSPASTPGTEKANNSWKYDVNPLGVSQIQMITGGFSAEYGNAQAGVVKVVLKEGGPKLNADFRVEFRPQGQYHFGDYLYSRDTYEWQKWGTLDQWMTKRSDVIRDLNLAIRYKSQYDYIKANPNDQAAQKQMTDIENREIEWAYNTWVKNHTPSNDNPLGLYDYRDYAYTRYLVGLGGPLSKNADVLRFYFSGEYRSNPTRLPTPEKVQVYQNYILNLTWQPVENQKFRIMNSFQKYRGGIWSGSDDIRWSGIAFVPDGVSTKYLVSVDPVRTEQTVAQSIDWVYTINPKSFLETQLSHQKEKTELPYDYLISNTQEADRLDSLADPHGQVLRDGTWWETSYYRAPINFSTNYYQDERSETYSLSSDYTNQMLSTNLVKAGFKFNYFDLFNNAVNSSYQADTYVARSGYAEYYHAYPINVAFYVQDKMEYEGMIANIGVRAEAFNFQANSPKNEFDVFYQGKSGPGKITEPYGDPSTVSSKTQYIVLPRIGLSFPIGETTAFRLQYGHFASMPIFSQGLSQRTDQGWLVIGNPNLEYKKTIQYEFGIQQLIDENTRLDLSLYYNDRVSQIGTQRIASYTGSLGAQGGIVGYTDDNIPLYPYTTYSNNAFGSTIGMEITLEANQKEGWSYRLSYTLSQTTEGNYGSQYIYPDGTVNQTRAYTSENISVSDRTHVFRGLLMYNVPESSFELFGVYPFDNSSVSLSYTAQSGLPFTYVTTFDLIDAQYNRRYPLEQSFDLSCQKDLSISGVRFTIGLRIMNLLDNKWLTPMSTLDLKNWIQRGVTMDNPADDPTRKSYVIAPFKTYRNIPRQIFITFGVGL